MESRLQIYEKLFEIGTQFPVHLLGGTRVVGCAKIWYGPFVKLLTVGPYKLPPV